MSRYNKPQAFNLKPNHWNPKSGTVVSLVPCGRNTYLWVGCDNEFFGSLSGPVTLRKLARTILREVPVPKKKTRKAKR